MNKITECPECGWVLSNSFITAQNHPKSPKWKRLGYCSLECYNDSDVVTKRKQIADTGRPYKAKKKGSPPLIVNILALAALDGMYFAGVALIATGALGFLSGDSEPLSGTLRWTGIAFLAGCVYGLRRLFQ